MSGLNAKTAKDFDSACKYVWDPTNDQDLVDDLLKADKTLRADLVSTMKAGVAAEKKASTYGVAKSQSKLDRLERVLKAVELKLEAKEGGRDFRLGGR